jgi:hypothetical protein
MSTSDKSPRDEFQLDIDSAIDNLFNPSRSIEIDPQTGEVKEKSAPEEATLSLSMEKDEASSGSEISFEQQEAKKSPEEQLLEELDQSFMALDWEISSTNIKNFQGLLSKTNALLKLDRQSAPGKVVLLMDQVLKAMDATPDELPATAVKTLQKGLVILREVADSDSGSMEAAASLAQKTIPDLEGILSASRKHAVEQPGMKASQEQEQVSTAIGSAAPEEDLSLPDEMILEIPDELLPLDLSNAINLHLTMLAQCINRILPLEKLFSQNPRYSKLLARHREIRELLEEEKDLITSALISDSAKSVKSPDSNIPTGLLQTLKNHLAALQNPITQLQLLEESFAGKKGYEKLSNIEHSILDQLQQQITALQNLIEGNPAIPRQEQSGVSARISAILANHITVLAECVKSLLPMENLFGKTKGYEKLYNLQKRIRIRISEQEVFLKKVLAGAGQTPLSTAPSDTENISSHEAENPPWPILRIGNWCGEKVGFIPEQIAFEDHAPACTKKLLKNDSTDFALNSLRKWPWTKLKPLLQNKLASLEEKRLSALEVPVLNNPSPIKKQPAKSGNETLILLYDGENGAAAVLDGPTKELSINPSYRWHPARYPGKKVLTGHLVTEKDTIPVISFSQES